MWGPPSAWICSILNVIAFRQISAKYAPMPVQFSSTARLLVSFASVMAISGVGLTLMVHAREQIDMLTDRGKGKATRRMQFLGRTVTGLSALMIIVAGAASFIGSLPYHKRWGFTLGIGCVFSFFFGICCLLFCLVCRMPGEKLDSESQNSPNTSPSSAPTANDLTRESRRVADSSEDSFLTAKSNLSDRGEGPSDSHVIELVEVTTSDAPSTSNLPDQEHAQDQHVRPSRRWGKDPMKYADDPPQKPIIHADVPARRLGIVING